MSELRVNTIAANSVSTINIDENTLVSGTLTATNTITGQGNIAASGNVTAGSGLIGTSLALGGGNINNAGTVNCTAVDASGNLSSDSLSVASGASVGSLTVDGEGYDQRVVVHCTVKFENLNSIQVGTGNPTRWSGTEVGDIELLNNRGVDTVAQVDITGFQSAIRITLNDSRTKPRFPTLINYLNDNFEQVPVFPFWYYPSNTTIYLPGGKSLDGDPHQVKYIQLAMFG